MTTLRPLEGDPHRVESIATTLAGMGEAVRSVHRVMLSLRVGAVWASPAGEAFEERVRELPPVLDRVSQRYDGAAAALAVFARELREAQDAATRACVAYPDAVEQFNLHGNAMSEAENAKDPADRAEEDKHRARMVEAGEVMHDMERRHAEALERFREADRRCAAALRRLADDELVDTRPYRLATGASDVAGGVSATAGGLAMVAPPLRPVTTPVSMVSSAGQVAIDGGVLLYYGDGSWTSIGVEAAANIAPEAAAVLRRSALASAAAGAVARGVARPSLGTALASGLRQYAKTDAPWVPAPPAAPKVVGRTARPWWRDRRQLKVDALRTRAVAEARHRANEAVLNDWRAVTDGGAQARGLLVGSVGLRVGMVAKDGIDKVNSARGVIDPAEQPSIADAPRDGAPPSR